MYLDKNVRHDYVPAVAGLQSRLLTKEKRISTSYYKSTTNMYIFSSNVLHISMKDPVCHHLDVCIGEQLEEPWLHVWLRVEGVRLLLDQSEVSIIASTNHSSPRPGPWTDSAASCPAAAASPWDSSAN